MALAYGIPIERFQPDGSDTLYRVEAVAYSVVVDAEREEYGSTAPRLEVFAFPVARWTEHGATLTVMSGARPKWVDLRADAKQWASRTIEEAATQFVMRRRAQLYVLARQIQRAEFELKLGVDYASGNPHIGFVSNGDRQ